MKKQVAIIGMGRFGTSLGEALEERGCQVLAIDRSEEKIGKISDKLTCCVQADCTDSTSLKSVGLRNFDVVVVAIGEIQASVMAVLHLKDMGIGHVIAKANSEIHAKLLNKIGADRVIFPERDMGIRIAQNIVAPNILDAIELSKDHQLVEWEVKKSWIGKNLRQIDFRRRFGVNIMAIKYHPQGQLDVSPNADKPLCEGDVLIMVGKYTDFNKMAEKVD